MDKGKYRLALDLGTTSLGWAVIRVKPDENNKLSPTSLVKAGVRIFSDGRNPKDGSSLAVSRREARSARRRRDRLLKRKNRMMAKLCEYGFFPADVEERKKLELLNPYEIRKRGLDEALTAHEFGRALFHINQRRGFKSNRKTDKAENDAGALKQAIKFVQQAVDGSQFRTVGEWLYARMCDGQTVRARYRESKVLGDNGKTRKEKSYDLYINRAMVEVEFDALWSKQSEFNSEVFSEERGKQLKDILLFQRNLRPVTPGRCTLLPENPRAPLAMPQTQTFRILQEVNNLRILKEDLSTRALTLEERNLIVDALNRSNKKTFAQLRKLIGLSEGQFNLEDDVRKDLKGNLTNVILAGEKFFGEAWFSFGLEKQGEIVQRLLEEEETGKLIQWLVNNCGVEESRAEKIADAPLVEGYGALCLEALNRIVPKLEESVITYDKAVLAAGFDHHSALSDVRHGVVLTELPYYGEALQRHVGFGSGDPNDHVEKRFGKIANPTVHIGLNQVRKVVNRLIQKYGLPSEVILEVARDLKNSKAKRDEIRKQQASNQARNLRIRKDISEVLNVSEDRVKRSDIKKWILWEELAPDVADRKCPYTGVQISKAMLLSDEVEIEHILPFSRTLDDSMNNKTVSMRQANRIKENKTPYEAFGGENSLGVNYENMIERVKLMRKEKRYRFAANAMEQWDRDGNGFLARALTDTAYLSRIAKQYLELICPQATRVIPGRMTAMLRHQFGLNTILSADGSKNRDDHRHHAIDACVIGVTDQALLNRFAKASGRAREQHLERLVDGLQPPWPSYRDQVHTAMRHLYVSHKPDHGYEGAMHNDTAYGILGAGKTVHHKRNEGVRERVEATLSVIPFTDSAQNKRHGVLEDGSPRPYKGYKGDSNYCLEIYLNEKGKWESSTVTTFEAYQIVRKAGYERLRDLRFSQLGKPLVVRFMIGDMVQFDDDGPKLFRVCKISGNGQIFFAPHFEANVDSRHRNADNPFKYTSKMAGSLAKSNPQFVGVNVIGEINKKFIAEA